MCSYGNGSNCRAVQLATRRTGHHCNLKSTHRFNVQIYPITGHLVSLASAFRVCGGTLCRLKCLQYRFPNALARCWVLASNQCARHDDLHPPRLGRLQVIPASLYDLVFEQPRKVLKPKSFTICTMSSPAVEKPVMSLPENIDVPDASVTPLIALIKA